MAFKNAWKVDVPLLSFRSLIFDSVKMTIWNLNSVSLQIWKLEDLFLGKLSVPRLVLKIVKMGIGR